MLLTTLTCPHCGIRIKPKNPIAAGKTVKCPKCANPFITGGEQETEPEPVESPMARKPSKVAKKPPPPPPVDDEEPDDEDDSPPQKSKESTGGPFVFEGNVSSYLGTAILASLLTTCTCGFAYPWAICMLLRWQIENTRVEGRRLQFTGTGGQLFGKWLVWSLLVGVTCGIYSLWLVPNLCHWITEHVEFAEE